MKHLYKYLLLGCISVAGFTSCDDAKSPVLNNAIYLIDATERDSYDCILKKMDRIDFNATVKMTSRVDHPVTITVTVDENDITEHNRKFAETLKLLPAENYYLTDSEGNKVEGNSVQLTLAPNETTALLPISILPVGEDDPNQYALPIRISGASNDIKVLGSQNCVLYMFQKPFETYGMLIEANNRVSIDMLNSEVPENRNWTVEFHMTIDINARDKHLRANDGQVVFTASTRGGGQLLFLRLYLGESYFDTHTTGTNYIADFRGGGFNDIANQGIWHHIAYVCKDGVLTSYLDGEKQNATSLSKLMNPMIWGTAQLGGDKDFGYYCMSELRLWTVARSVDDLKRNKYNISPDAKGLFLLMHLNDVNNAFLTDSSHNGFNVDISEKTNTKNNVRWCKIRTDDEFKSFITVD